MTVDDAMVINIPSQDCQESEIWGRPSNLAVKLVRSPLNRKQSSTTYATYSSPVLPSTYATYIYSSKSHFLVSFFAFLTKN